jgi:hypothetical protein
MPSLNTGNAILSNAIAVDSSYNVGIGGAASGSFKLQVTGTSNLTGALSGTSALFSNNLEAGRLGGAVSIGDLFVDSANNSVYVGRQSSTSGDNSKFYVRNRLNTLTALSVDPGGNGAVDVVGTFSSTRGTNLATATGNVGVGVVNPTGTYGKLSVAGGISILNDNNAKLEIGRYSSGVSNSYIKLGASSNNLFITNNNDTVDIFTITNGGNIGIGTTTPTNGKLEIQTGTTAAALWVQTGGTTSASTIVDFRTGSNLSALNILGNGVANFGASVAVGDSVSLLGELYWGGFSSGQKVRAYTTGASGSATLNFSFWDGSAWQILGNLTSAGVWTTTGGGTSDARTKDEIDYNFDNGIESILKLQPTKFKFKIAPNKQRRGFIAQDVLTTIPDLVLGDGEKENGTYGLDYDGILAIAVKAIQELNQKVNEQQQTINSLINR